MSRIRDLAKILTASTDVSTDAEVTSSIASHAAAADPHAAYLKESEFGAAGKNLVINGGFDIWQRGTSFAIGSFQYSADRWRVGRGAFETGATFSRQNADLQGFRYCIRAQRNSGNTTTGGGYLATSFETSDSLRFSGQPVVLSFYAKRSSGFTGFGISVILQNGTGIDEINFTESNFATGANNIINSAASTLTTSWQRFTYTGTVPSNSTQLGIRFIVAYSGTAPADDYVDITGVQLEVGSVATPFSRAGGNIQGELAACQRYFSTSYQNGVAVPTAGGSGGLGVMFSYPANAAAGHKLGAIYYPVRMRANPTVTIYSYTSATSNVVSDATGADLAANTGTPYLISAYSVYVYNNTANTIFHSQGGYICHFAASAEL